MVCEGWTRRFTLRRSPPSRNRRKQAKPSWSLNADHRPAIFGCSSPERRRAMSSALPYRNSRHDANTCLCLNPSPHLPRDVATDVTLLFFLFTVQSLLEVPRRRHPRAWQPAGYPPHSLVQLGITHSMQGRRILARSDASTRQSRPAMLHHH